MKNYIYYAIPNESTSCSAASVGCREYKGNAGYNVQENREIYLFYDHRQFYFS